MAQIECWLFLVVIQRLSMVVLVENVPNNELEFHPILVVTLKMLDQSVVQGFRCIDAQNMVLESCQTVVLLFKFNPSIKFPIIFLLDL